jgi:Tol biopolymer transport system component
VTKEATIQRVIGRGKRRRSAFLVLALGGLLAASVSVAGTAQQAQATTTDRVFFASSRTTGTGVNNPTGDFEIFKMNPDGSGVRQLTTNEATDYGPVLSRDGTEVAYQSWGVQTSNPEGDSEVYVMNASDGTGKKNLTHTGDGVEDYSPVFSPGGKKIAYDSEGAKTSNPEGDTEVYRMSALDGTAKKNLSNNGDGVYDYYPVFSPDGTKITYWSIGIQTSNPEGDADIYRLNVLDGTGKKNLTHNGADVKDYDPVFSPDGKRIAYESSGIQTSNPEGDSEVYVMNASDGKAKKNLTNTGADVGEDLPLFSPGGTKIAYESYGKQTSNPEGEYEVYRMNALDGSHQTNLTNNGADVNDSAPVVFSPDGTKIAYNSYGIQSSNPEGDIEMYRMNTLDGLGKKNLTHNSSGASDYPGDWGVLGR